MSESIANTQTYQVLDDLEAEFAHVDGDIDRQRVIYDRIFSQWTEPVDRPVPQQRVHCSYDEVKLSLLLIEPPAARRTVVYLHGGGWALGSAECYAPLGQQLAQMLDARVVLVDYPLAPEHTFPAAHHASCAAVGWAAENCPGELIIAGDSAGGQLAATTCLNAGVAGKLAGQLSIYPVIDLRQNADYPSRKQLGQGGWFLTEAKILGASAGYAGDVDPGDPRLTPLTADSLSATPPSVVYLPEFDPLKDEGSHYAERLKADRVPVETVSAGETIHGCASFSGRIPSALHALRRACRALLNLMEGKGGVPTRNLLEEPEPILGYPDLDDPEFVYRALLEYGMFSDKLPPCFKSTGLMELLGNKPPEDGRRSHGYVEYFASRDSNVPRGFCIPHPDSYYRLCGLIKKHWKDIKSHIGKTERKNYVHVGKIEDKPYIFDMNYQRDQSKKEQHRNDYLVGCTHVVKTDVSNCFPSIYSHSVAWALMGKEEAKNNQNKDRWENELDKLSRYMKNNETNGLLPGVHTSYILADIILTRIDRKLCGRNYGKYQNYIRQLDDYEFYATSEELAHEYIKILTLCLKEYDLSINQEKTKIIPISDYRPQFWTGRLKRHYIFFSKKAEDLKFSDIEDFIEHAQDISKAAGTIAPLNYAIHLISEIDLPDKIRFLYIQRITAMAAIYPYLFPLLESHVFKFSDEYNEIHIILENALPKIIRMALNQNQTDAIAFAFYFAAKYDIQVDLGNNKDAIKILEEVCKLKDCISILLAWKYCVDGNIHSHIFDEFASQLLGSDKKEQDKYWIFLYEHALHHRKDLDCQKQPLLFHLMSKGFSFFKDKEHWEPWKKEYMGY